MELLLFVGYVFLQFEVSCEHINSFVYHASSFWSCVQQDVEDITHLFVNIKTVPFFCACLWCLELGRDCGVWAWLGMNFTSEHNTQSHEVKLYSRVWVIRDSAFCTTSFFWGSLTLDGSFVQVSMFSPFTAAVNRAWLIKSPGMMQLKLSGASQYNKPCGVKLGEDSHGGFRSYMSLTTKIQRS